MKGGCRHHLVFRIGETVDGPAIEAFECCVLFFEGHVEGLVRLLRDCGRISETGIVPPERLWRKPLRFAFVSRVLDHDPHAMMTVVVGKIAHDPHSRMIHFDDSRDALRRAEPEHGYANRFGQGIAIHRNYAETVPGKRKASDLPGAAV